MRSINDYKASHILLPVLINKNNPNFYYEGTSYNYGPGGPQTSYLYKKTYGCIVSEEIMAGAKYRVMSVCDRDGAPFPSEKDYAEILAFFDMEGYESTVDVPHDIGKSRYFIKKIA